jgi:hypothetical protein
MASPVTLKRGGFPEYTGMADPEEAPEQGETPGVQDSPEQGVVLGEGAMPVAPEETPPSPVQGERGTAPESTVPGGAGESQEPGGMPEAGAAPEVKSPPETEKYRKFKKVDGATYQKVNKFLRKHTYLTAREWAIARLCADFKTTGGSEMTYIGEHLPELVPFMTDPYSPQAVNQARSAFKKKVKKAGATFFYGAMCGFFTADELDDILFESSEVARFLLEVEGTTLDVDQEIDVEDRITDIMRNVAESAARILRERPGRGEEEGEP